MNRRKFLIAAAAMPLLPAICVSKEPETVIGGPSPEETGNYLCRFCGNDNIFKGIDYYGYPGEACECGHGRHGLDECVCQCRLVQVFYAENGEVKDYLPFTGGGYGAEIGSYSEIVCLCCNTTIWKESIQVR